MAKVMVKGPFHRGVKSKYSQFDAVRRARFAMALWRPWPVPAAGRPIPVEDEERRGVQGQRLYDLGKAQPIPLIC